MTRPGVIRRAPVSAWAALALIATDAATVDAELLINEVDSDTPGTDAAEFVEIINGGLSGVPLSGVSLVFFNGNGDVSYFALDLNPLVTLPPGEYYLIGNPAVPNANQTFDPALLQNGPDAVALYQAPASSFPNGTPVTAANLLDAVVYDTADADDAGLLNVLTPGEAQIDEGSGTSAAVSISRVPEGAGGPRETDFYTTTIPTPMHYVVPEPAALAMLGIGAATLLGRHRRRTYSDTRD